MQCGPARCLVNYESSQSGRHFLGAMNSSAFPPRGSSLSPRSQNLTPPAILSTTSFPAYPQISSPIRRKPLPPTALTSLLPESPIDAGVLQTASGNRPETHPARKDDQSPNSVVRDLDRCVPPPPFLPVQTGVPHKQRYRSRVTHPPFSLDFLEATLNRSRKIDRLL